MILAILSIAVFLVIVKLAISRNMPQNAPASVLDAPLQGPPSPERNVWTTSDVRNLIREICGEEDYLNVPLALAIARVESSYRVDAINLSDRPPSVGVMQIKLPTARAYVPEVASQEQLQDPFLNIRAGVRFLQDLERKWIRTWGLDGVIQMYNLGETRFLRGERNPVYLGRVKSSLGL